MESIFYKNRFYPQNFYFVCESNSNVEMVANTVSKEAKRLSPESFNGESYYFKFVLHYSPPYEHDRYSELKRLQEVARSYTRFKDEYRGYIVIDVSEWLNHFTEELFSVITMAFLSDMSDYWKYLFVSDGGDLSKEDLRIMNKYLKVKKLNISNSTVTDTFSHFFKTLQKKYDIRFSPQAAEVFKKYLSPSFIKVKESLISIENDIRAFFGEHSNIKKEMLMEYFSVSDSVCYDYISEKDIDEILRIIREEPRI